MKTMTSLHPKLMKKYTKKEKILISQQISPPKTLKNTKKLPLVLF